MPNTAKAMWNARVAIEQNDPDQLRAMLAQQPELATLSINTQPGYRNLMHIAAASGNLAICSYLHGAGVAMDTPAPRESRVTPLTEAAGSGRLAIVDWLLQQGRGSTATRKRWPTHCSTPAASATTKWPRACCRPGQT
ncbi:ankyrin repeat domain-containing protein [Pseudomonas aeruginosa]|nr:ankyrin repeat domain-containing protein [Pseudomonas aeruginosa]